MVKEILTYAGFIENETFKETRFLKPPKASYSVYMDSFTRRGGDGVNLIKEHDYTIELYAYSPDPEAESRLENSFDHYGIEYEKDERYWIQEEQLYQTIYSFSHIEK